MSAVSTSRAKKGDPLAKKTPTNPKYSHIEHTVDTGASVTSYVKKVEEIKKNYNFRPNELFKRMKVTTFVQLLLQIEEMDGDSNSEYTNGQYTDRTDSEGRYSVRPDTADREVQQIQGRGRRSPVNTSRSGGGGDTERTRSKLQDVISGEGEIPEEKPPQVGKVHDCPYLLLDLRDSDCFKQCHIITAKSYPSAMLSRSVNFDTKEMYAYKNQEGKIIIVYDEDETIANTSATTLVQRGYDNLFLLSGGMRVAYKAFPEGLFTGTPSQKVTEAKNPPKTIVNASQDRLTMEDCDKLGMCLNNALMDKSSSSRLSNNSTASSRMSVASRTSKASKPDWAVKDHKPFRV